MSISNDPRIECIARALCEVEGHDPDKPYQRTVSGEGFPRWHAYRGEAIRFLAATLALEAFKSAK